VLSRENNPGIGYMAKGSRPIRFEIFPHCGHATLNIKIDE